MTSSKKKKIRISIFASGSGTNTERIIKYFERDEQIVVSSVFTNNPNAYVITRAKNHYIPVFTFNRDDFYKSNKVVDILHEQGADFIILAGFLWLVPSHIVKAFENRILNIHPALLPSYGGKGMYGENVHKAVHENGEPETGITIHKVNEKYDDGDIVFQEKVILSRNDTPDTIAAKVHELEYEHFPRIIKQFVSSGV
jgi:phosphoribosylglycinamide formyltransferase-1